MPQPIPAVTGADHARGPGEAPFTLVEYADFQCPYCREAALQLELVRTDLAGALRIVYRHFPLTDLHAYAELAAQTAEAAGAQGRFWEMHDALFSCQPRFSLDLFVELAYSLGLDEDLFLDDLRRQRYLPRVRRDLEAGERAGVSGTPSLFLGGERYRGSWEAHALRAELERRLSARKTG